MKDTSVKVALRIRPLISKEIKEGCVECLNVYDGKQVNIRGAEKAFTYDYSFDSLTDQETVYEKSVSKLVDQLFKGYNVTILAYGQTGSGKTYSMGTAYDSRAADYEIGIIPRAVKDIFEMIAEKNENILVKSSFVELYNETLFDLLSPNRREDAVLDIREDAQGGINIPGLTEIGVGSLEETVRCLELGSKNRVTGSTAMNATSSRSHAIFTLHFEIQQNENDPMTAKFHLVDLAGSERAKKTKAVGERFREGININKGLLALGNVISALCLDSGKTFIPYRDSKLTRLLQDSLGGNSLTLMIACVSPADSNLEETMSTLRYADRAKHIKNKPIVNRDPRAAEIAALRKQVQDLQMQILESGVQAKSIASGDISEVVNLKMRIEILEEENNKLTKALQTALDENTNMAEKAILAEMAREQLKRQLEELKVQTGNTVEALNKSLNVSCNPQYIEQLSMVRDLQKRVHMLQDDQQKRERAIIDHDLSRHSVSTNTSVLPDVATDSVHCGTNSAHSDPSSAHANDPEEDASPIKGEFGTAFTLKQAKLNEELNQLNRALAMKEELMNKISSNDDQFTSIRVSYEKNQKDLENQISDLVKEKEALLARLRTSNSNAASSKIAEQRRKRVQELESMIGDLKKKVVEQSKLLKIKEQSEKKVSQLNSDIHSMKAARVKLIRQIKEDSEKFRRWKMQKDREVEKLKVEDRKKQFQIVKMERLHNKQQSVYKRKLEEASSINKRLKEAVALQKACQSKRMASKDVEGMNNRVKCWLEGELEVMFVKKQAQKSLETLLQERKRLSEQLVKVKSQISKKEHSAALQKELEDRRDNIEKELSLRTTQINDIQTKMVDQGDEDTCLKKAVDSLQTMLEAKSAVRHLLQVTADKAVNSATAQAEAEELASQNEETGKSLQETEARLAALKEEHENELSRLAREHEEKVLFLLRQMPKTNSIGDGTDASPEAAGERGGEDSKLVQRLKIQEEELSRMSHLHDLLQQANVEKELMAKRLRELEMRKSASPEKKFATPEAQIKPIKISKAKAKNRKPMQTPDFFDEPISSSDEENVSESDDDKDLDPDWRETPLFKRIKHMTIKRRIKNNVSAENTSAAAASSSRDASDINNQTDSLNCTAEVKCGCSKNCSSRSCKCRKNGSSCASNCKCNPMICENRIAAPKLDVSEETLLNSTFEVAPRKSQEPLSESSVNVPQKRRRISGNKSSSSGIENDPGRGFESIDINDYTLPPL